MLLNKYRADGYPRIPFYMQGLKQAEAALKLNGIFEAADKAARQYLENIRRQAPESCDRL